MFIGSCVSLASLKEDMDEYCDIVGSKLQLRHTVLVRVQDEVEL